MVKSEYIYLYTNYGFTMETFYEFYSYFENKPINLYKFKSAYEKWKAKIEREFNGANGLILKEKFNTMLLIINDILFKKFGVVQVFSKDDELITIF
jgi:hypothetical protein